MKAASHDAVGRILVRAPRKHEDKKNSQQDNKTFFQSLRNKLVKTANPYSSKTFVEFWDKRLDHAHKSQQYVAVPEFMLLSALERELPGLGSYVPLVLLVCIKRPGSLLIQKRDAQALFACFGHELRASAAKMYTCLFHTRFRLYPWFAGVASQQVIHNGLLAMNQRGYYLVYCSSEEPGTLLLSYNHKQTGLEGRGTIVSWVRHIRLNWDETKQHFHARHERYGDAKTDTRSGEQLEAGMWKTPADLLRVYISRSILVETTMESAVSFITRVGITMEQRQELSTLNAIRNYLLEQMRQQEERIPEHMDWLVERFSQ